MRAPSFARQLSFLTMMLLSIGATGQPASAQAPAPTLPANWQQLSPTDFAALIRQYFEQETFKSLDAGDQADLADHGAALFTKIDISNTPLNYQTLDMLQWVGRGIIDQNVTAGAKLALMARQDNWAGQPYAEIRGKVAMMMRLKVPDPVLIAEARRWIAAGGTLAQVPKQDLGYEIVRQVFADLKIVSGSFSVTWTGQINAPQSGDYTFFISPIDVNAGFHEHPLNVSMSVSLAGQEIINAVPPTQPDPLSRDYQRGQFKSNWISQSNPVTLTAGTPVRLNVTATVDTSAALPTALLHAMLFWQGPGIAKTVVPSSALSTQSGAPGLQATYTWNDSGKPQSLTRTDATIDFAWTNSPILLAQDTTIASQAAEAMWQAMTSTDFISSYATGTSTGKLHPFLRDPDDASSGLSTARRQAFLDLLLQNPALLDPMDAKTAVRFFQAFRVGTPDKALSVFGTWAARHADITSEFSTEEIFEGDARFAYASMAICTTQQLPSQAGLLLTEYLQLPDGRCSLPVAYTLACSYLGLKKSQNWNALLDAKLADPTVAGDLRINWLLARANAAELDSTWAVHYPAYWGVPALRPLWGRNYLGQAFAAAQSSSVKLRTAKEILTVLVWAHLLKDASDFLQSLSTSLPDDAKPQIGPWQKLLGNLVAADVQAPQQQAAAAKQAYLNALKARRDQAAKAGDAAAVSRYDALISANSK